MACELPPEMRRVIGKYAGCQITRSRLPYLDREEDKPTDPDWWPGEREPWGISSFKCESQVFNAMERMARWVGSGVHRHAFRFEDKGGKDCVVKIARGADKGTEANRLEAKAWASIPQYAQEYFLPVRHADTRGWYNTTPYAESGISEDEADDLDEAIRAKGIACIDIHTSNAGYYDGRPVVLDYGFGATGARCKLRTKDVPRAKTGGPRPRMPVFALRRAARVVR